MLKLDLESLVLGGLSPKTRLITDPPPTSFTTLYQKKIKLKIVTHDMWHVTWDTSHMTHDTFHVTHDRWGRWTYPQNFSSLALTVWEWRCSEDISAKDHWVNQWITKVFVEQPRLHRVSLSSIYSVAHI